MRAYSNNGHSFRTFGAADVLDAGEVLLGDDASSAQIAAAFPHYNDPVPVTTVLSQDLMTQFTAADAAAIQAAIAGNVQFWLLWASMQAQKDPMQVTNARFL